MNPANNPRGEPNPAANTQVIVNKKNISLKDQVQTSSLALVANAICYGNLQR